MQSEISIGTVLQNRYRITGLLGQGGFGRTYLAENQRRFNELCALKEFTPPQGDYLALQKAHELFLREAATLYQIDHPQIPKFRETFEADGRLFLVQDYVAGKTYGTWLTEKKQAGEKFLEAEVFALMDRLLPVLDYIHQKGIIHRDISPENIICRESDRLPILIDFGVVKALVSQMQLTDSERPNTTVGKIGYAPSEQIQSGRSYPSSDLYSLAVSAIVLLSGREPQELFDDATLSWQWEKFVHPPMNQDFAHVLHRMLSYQPGRRYQSVPEVAYIFDQLKRYNLSAVLAEPPVNEPGANPNSQPNFSELQTMAIAQNHIVDSDRTSDRTDGNRDTSHGMIYTDNEDRSPLLESPIAIGALLVVVSLFTGITSWLVVMAFNQPQTPETKEQSAIFSNPEIPSANIPTLPNTPTTTPTQQATGNQEQKQGSRGAEEQRSRGTEEPPTSGGAEEPPSSRGAEGMGRNTSPSDRSTSAPTEKPTPTPEPKPQTYNQPVEISLGVPQVFQGNLKAKETINYKIQGQAGEELLTFVSGQGVLMKVIGPNGEMMENVSMWEGALPSTGEYTIALSPLPDLPGSNYDLQIQLNPGRAAAPPTATEPDRPSPTATEPDRPSPASPSPVPIEVAPNPQPTETEAENLPPSGSSGLISFPGGAGVEQIYDTTTPDQIKSYFVNVEEGKTLKAEIFLGAVSLDIRDPNGNLLKNAEQVVFWQGQATMTGEYQIDVIASEPINFSLEIQVRD
jgi:serine/threonine protein kinase